jgi:general secretion pathway protein K
MSTRPSPRPSPKGEGEQRGLAAVTAILVVAVAASAAALMLAQQSAMLDQTMLVASRAQADLYARAGLDWARGVLLEDARTRGAVDSLDEPWAQPIAALPVERAVVSGSIADEQAKFNLNNLVKGSNRSDADVNAFRRLLASLGLAPDLADAVVDWIDTDDDLTSGAGAENAYYLSLKKPYRAANQPMVQVEELYRVRGFDAAAVARLRPYVTALPGEHTTVNVNTASDLVLAALLQDVPKEKIAKLVIQRRTQPLKSKQEIAAWAAPAAVPDDLDVKSSFFSVYVLVAQDEVELASDALVQRAQNGVAAIIWRRPRY